MTALAKSASPRARELGNYVWKTKEFLRPTIERGFKMFQTDTPLEIDFKYSETDLFTWYLLPIFIPFFSIPCNLYKKSIRRFCSRFPRPFIARVNATKLSPKLIISYPEHQEWIVMWLPGAPLEFIRPSCNILRKTSELKIDQPPHYLQITFSE